MSKLSPAAQEIIDASWGGIPAGMRDPYAVRCEQMAATLRVAARNARAGAQRLPSTDWGEGWIQGVNDVACGLESLADQLEVEAKADD